MVNGINSISHINYYKPSFRASEQQAMTNPIVQNSSLNGVDALASYNSAFINKKDDDFDIKTVDFIDIPQNPNLIKGEKIYNSDGELVRIIDEDEDFRTIYTPNEDNKNFFDYEKYDKKTNEMIEQQEFYHSADGNDYFYVIDVKNGAINSTHYKYENGTITLKEKSKDLSNGSASYDYDKQEYTITCCDKDNYIRKCYDKNKQLKYISNDDEKTNYYHDKPINTVKTESKAVTTDFGLDPLNDKDLTPTPYCELGNTDNIDGQKFYYSNGTIEKVVTPDGKVYSYDLDGNFESLQDGNKTVLVQGGSVFIKETLGNGSDKTTTYIDKELKHIEYRNGDNFKTLYSYGDNIVYRQCDDGYTVFQADVDKDTGKISNPLTWHYSEND